MDVSGAANIGGDAVIDVWGADGCAISASSGPAT